MHFGLVHQCTACIEEAKTGHTVPNTISQVSDKWEQLLILTYSWLTIEGTLVGQTINVSHLKNRWWASVLFVYAGASAWPVVWGPIYIGHIVKRKYVTRSKRQQRFRISEGLRYCLVLKVLHIVLYPSSLLHLMLFNKNSAEGGDMRLDSGI